MMRIMIHRARSLRGHALNLHQAIIGNFSMPCTSVPSLVCCSSLRRKHNSLRLCGNDNSIDTFGCFDDEQQLLEILQDLQISIHPGIRASTDTFHLLLQECINKKDLAVGRKVHSLIRSTGFESNVFLGNWLIRMFASCGNLVEANLVCSNLPKKDVFTWTAIISAHIDLGQVEAAIHLYQCMIQSNVKPDSHIFVTALKACVCAASVAQGRLIHVHIIESGFESHVIISNTLIDMHAKCGNLEDARWVFDKLTKRSVVTWTAMITAYTQFGHCQETLQLFQEMQQGRVEANNVTFVNVLKGCSSMAALHEGKLIHACIVRRGIDVNAMVCNTIMDMYVKCGSLQDACNMFDKIENRLEVTWNVMIAGYLHCGNGWKALQLFQEMRCEGVLPNNVTFINTLKACSSIADSVQGKVIHARSVESGFESELFTGNTLIDMYNKCGSVEDARCVFDRLPKQDSVTWNAMITGYAQHWYGQEALELFNQMQQKGMMTDTVTFVSILKACSSIAAIDQGKVIHAHITENGSESNILVGNALLDMYARCGSLEDAWGVFKILPKQDVVTWNTMMAGYALNNNYILACQCFKVMQQEGLKPNEVSFVCLLSACSHGGLVDQGCHEFKSMRFDYDILPTVDHYNCMVDLFGRAGFLDEAKGILQSVSFELNHQGWTSLLSHCRTHGNVKLGRQCFDHLVTMNGSDAAGHILMSNIYADAGLWMSANGVEEHRSCRHAWKKPGNTFIEVKRKVYSFTVKDKSHPQTDDVYTKLRQLSWKMKMGGYVPFLDLVLQQILDEDKEIAFFGGLEKLSIDTWLNSTPQGAIFLDIKKSPLF